MELLNAPNDELLDRFQQARGVVNPVWKQFEKTNVKEPPAPNNMEIDLINLSTVGMCLVELLKGLKNPTGRKGILLIFTNQVGLFV